VFRHACKLGRERIVSKQRASSRYSRSKLTLPHAYALEFRIGHRAIGNHKDPRGAFAAGVSRRKLVAQKAAVTGEQFEIPHRVAQLELEPTTLVPFENCQRSQLIGSGVAEIDNWAATVIEDELAIRIEQGNSRSSSRPVA
jgi:hypothetical protein